ncbi:hypothetical protein IKM_05110, partial [Bacillus mycoides]
YEIKRDDVLSTWNVYETNELVQTRKF